MDNIRSEREGITTYPTDIKKDKREIPQTTL